MKAPIPKQERHFYSFDAFRLYVAQRELFRGGESVALTPKAFDALFVMVSHHGHIVDKDELIRTLWPDTFVEEASLVQQISHLRKVLGERPGGGPYVETVARRGYRFAAPVTESWEEEPAEPHVAVHPRSRRLLQPSLAAVAVIVLAAAGVFVWERMQAKPFTERDWIVLADFTNTTGDTMFDGALKQALSASLNQSPYLNVVPEERVGETLRLMEQPPDVRVTGPLARELCVRAGVKALLAGSIAAVGNHYSIGLDAMNCSTGDTLAQEQVEAENKDGVLGALGQAGSRMRRKLGESLASIEKMDVPIQEATTSSLEALKAYSFGRRQHSNGRMRAARPFYRRAIELDPNFASAFEWLAFTYRNLGEVLASQEFFTRAFELRQRVSERERLFFEASYYVFVVGDLVKAQEVYSVWMQMYPRDWFAFNDTGLFLYAQTGQHEKALELYREADRVGEGAFVFPITNQARTYVALDRYAEARAMLDRAVKEFNANHADLFRLAWIEGDTVGMDRLVAWSAGRDSGILQAQAEVAAFGGQIHKSRDLWRRALEILERDGAREARANELSSEAVFEAQVGNLPQAREAVKAALGLARGQSVLYRAALVEAFGGSAGPTQKLLDELLKAYPQATLVNRVALPVVQAALEISRGNPDRAAALLESAAPYELGGGIGCRQVLYLRGQAHLRAGMGNDAAEAFKKILDHRGVFIAGVYPLAYLGLGRAQALAGNTAEARKAYRDFLALWKDAGSDIPILKEAKQEYAKLK